MCVCVEGAEGGLMCGEGGVVKSVMRSGKSVRPHRGKKGAETSPAWQSVCNVFQAYGQLLPPMPMLSSLDLGRTLVSL